MNKEEFAAWVLTDEGKSIVNPFVDSRVTQAIHTFESKHPNNLNLGSRLDEIEKAIETKDSELNKQKLNNFIIRKCFESQIDPDLLEGFQVTDEKSVVEKIEQLSKLRKDSTTSQMNGMLSNNSFRPSGKQDKDDTKKTWNQFVLEAESRDLH